MKKKLAVLIGILAFALFIGGAGILYDRMSAENQPVENTTPAETQPADSDEETAEPFMAPDFVVADGEGNPASLSDFIGKPVILNFWASWCGPCKSEMPDFNAAYQEYGDQIQFMMINLTDGDRESVQTASDYIAEAEYSFPVFFDTESSAAMAYGATSIPVTYFVDETGELIAYGRGAISAKALQSGIDMLLPAE